MANRSRAPNVERWEHMNRTFTIRQLTKEFSVTARTLRFYEDEGLIGPERRGQTRIYSVKDRARIILILRGRRLGFSLAEIREYLDMYNQADNSRQLSHARKKCEERIVAFEKQKVDIDIAINELKRSLVEIDQHLSDIEADKAAPLGEPAEAPAAAAA
ncbi:DNA-binding transcriptional MerR regulator [Rhizomicrobium palustre]|jgi:DNA-binding transcriptional MerR regulator|uniref:DNA-binding transcriptional MerR regulator n=1 Tax=Rhizomicrobium palustre TaxID=189966 RepID=A0A846MWB3_9PROT|nr:MerR family DNA-binding transcriptional regulator [Rhizomicrobium palustre]NIK87686.1 DNA-binding transcriptional MerR regulator [Rhizomicrobium palustre]